MLWERSSRWIDRFSYSAGFLDIFRVPATSWGEEPVSLVQHHMDKSINKRPSI